MMLPQALMPTLPSPCLTVKTHSSRLPSSHRWLPQVRELEGVVHERDAMAARLSTLEARLDETRSERGQVGWAARVGLLEWGC